MEEKRVPVTEAEYVNLLRASKRLHLNESSMWKAAECVEQMKKSAEKLSQLYMKKMQLLAGMKIKDTEHFEDGLTYQIILSKHKNVLELNSTQYQTAANEAVKIRELVQSHYLNLSPTEDLHCLSSLVHCGEEATCAATTVGPDAAKCHAKALPLSNFCKEHIYQDKSQCLYSQCKYVEEGESRKRCVKTSALHSSTHVNCLPSYITPEMHKQIEANNYLIGYCKEHVVHDENIVKNIKNELDCIQEQLEKISKD